MGAVGLEAPLVAAARASFPDALALLLWGGTLHPDDGPIPGDLDLLIVLPDGADDPSEPVRARLAELASTAQTWGVDLDPAATTRVRLAGDCRTVTAWGVRAAHGMDRYQMRRSRLLWGDGSALDALSAITIDDALADCLPFVRDVFLARLRQDPSSVGGDVRIVIVRTLYTQAERAVASKGDALAWLAQRWPELSPVAAPLAGQSGPPPAEALERFVRLAEERLSA